MNSRDLIVGEIVQLSPDSCRNKMFGGCMMVVTKPKPWGAQGYVQALGVDGKIGGQAYYRAKYDEMESTLGMTQWDVLSKSDKEDDDNDDA